MPSHIFVVLMLEELPRKQCKTICKNGTIHMRTYKIDMFDAIVTHLQTRQAKANLFSLVSPSLNLHRAEKGREIQTILLNNRCLPVSIFLGIEAWPCQTDFG